MARVGRNLAIPETRRPDTNSREPASLKSSLGNSYVLAPPQRENALGSRVSFRCRVSSPEFNGPILPNLHSHRLGLE
jgi:hypothetical protein